MLINPISCTANELKDNGKIIKNYRFILKFPIYFFLNHQIKGQNSTQLIDLHTREKDVPSLQVSESTLRLRLLKALRGGGVKRGIIARKVWT